LEAQGGTSAQNGLNVAPGAAAVGTDEDRELDRRLVGQLGAKQVGQVSFKGSKAVDAGANKDLACLIDVDDEALRDSGGGLALVGAGQSEGLDVDSGKL